MSFRSWFGTRREPAASIEATIAEGQRLYAIGDVHGRYDLLVELIGRIEADDAARGPADTRIVMLGDLVDRGPNSCEVIDFLLNDRPDFARFHFLMGNHEEAMLASLAPGADPRETGWLAYGGLETLESYLVPEDAFAFTGTALSDELRLYVPKEHLAFLSSFTDSLHIGDYLFVHAGIRPHIAIDKQRPADLRWIRDEFLDSEEDHGVVVVHGHTIRPEPEFRANRIGIDTGAYRTGVLTVLGLEGGERWTIATGATAARGMMAHDLALGTDPN